MRPYVLVIAGPNGSGKSTLIRQLQREPAFPFPDNYINADDIERELAPDIAGAKSERERMAFQEARRRRQQFRDEGVPHAFETVFSHASNLLDLQRLRTAGFDLTLCWVATEDSSLNVERVKRRVAAGGHDIPEDKIRARYIRSLKFLPRAAEIAHVTYIYDNSDSLLLVGHLVAGEWHPALPDAPTYLTEGFLRQIEARQSERTAMAELGGEDGLDLPNEENGRYKGVVVATGTHYLVQEIKEDGILTRYRHDALCLSDAPTQEWAGKVALIRYGQSEYGLGTVSFP